MSLVRERASKRAAGLPGAPPTAGLADLPGFAVQAAFLDHCPPSLAQVLPALAADGGHDITIVPLLLTAAYHAAIDVPAQLATASAGLPRLRLRQAAALGPHPLLLAAAQRRLGQAIAPGLPAERTSVVLAAAGSSDPQANAQVAELAARWQETSRWRRVVPAYASAASPSPADAVRALRDDDAGGQVVVATYLLAPGYFADKVLRQARQAGAAAVSAPLGAAPEVADVIIDRYLEAVHGPFTARSWLPVAAPQDEVHAAMPAHRYESPFHGQ